MPNDEISQIQLPNGDVYDIRDGNVSDFKTNIDEETLSDGQVLKYNEDTGEWENSENDLELLNTASGSIATFSDGGDGIPVNLFECEIVAQQAEGTPTPANPLPITGFSEADISVTSKNLCNWKVNTTSYPLIISLPKGTYTISSDGQSTFGYWYFRFTDIDGNVISDNPSQFGLSSYAYSSSSQYFYGGNNRTYVTFILPDNGYTVRIGTLNGDGTISAMLARGSTAIAYEPYKGNLYTVSFGQTIYSGRLIYSNGAWAIEADKAMNLISDLDWSYNATSTRFSTSDLRDIVKNAESTSIPLEGLSCECYVNNVAGSSRQIDLSVAVNTTGIILLKDTNYSDVSSLLSAVGNYKIVYPLETPVIIPLTSTVKVKTISGLNNIYSNTGDISLEYFVNKSDDIDKLINAEKSTESSDYHVYSTDEQIVGKWIDGNDIYEKTVTISNATIRVNGGYSYDISGWNVDVLVKSPDAYIVLSSGTDLRTVPFGILGSYAVEVYASRSAVSFARKGADLTCDQIVFTLRYTKTSSNTRSLNLSKGSSEELPIEEKKEDLKEPEEVKEVQDE